MQMKESDVKSQGEVVAKAEYPEFETLDEVVEELGERRILKTINASIRTDAMNVARTKVVGRGPSQTVTLEALARCTVEEIAECAGDLEKLKELVANKLG